MILFLDAISDPCNMFSSSLTAPHTEATARSTHSLLGLAMVRRYSWHKQPWGTLSGETHSKPLYNPPSDLEHNLGCLVRIHGSKATSIQRTFPGEVANFESEFVMFVIFVGNSQLIFLRNLTKATSMQNLLPSLLAFSHAATRKPDFDRAFLNSHHEGDWVKTNWAMADTTKCFTTQAYSSTNTILGWLTSYRSC